MVCSLTPPQLLNKNKMKTAKGREIKFRAFIDGEMVILPLAGLQYFDFEGSYALSFVVDGYKGFWAHEQYDTSTKKIQDSPIMQSTGLIDKNGVEIYESDLLINPEGKVGIVVWHEGGFYLQCDRKSGQPFFVALTNGFVANKLQIGNIYQNPELLNQ